MVQLKLPQHPPKVLVFSDFDGTITTQDTGTLLIDHCMGYENRRALDVQILDGTLSFRSAVAEMWNSVDLNWEEALRLLKDVKIDLGFEEFHHFCNIQRIPLVVLSSGLSPLVKMFLQGYAENNDLMEILANDVIISRTGDTSKWEIVYRDESSHGHDKSLAIKAAKEQYTSNPPLIVFAGDGVSDISAAREADIVFAKKGKDLEKWCIRESVDYIPWEDFRTILHVVKAKISA
ncbi:2,3-diketo-5-methylthio-1-phosphopentane phosphatase [Spizellomyces punctatus DAOM BR117]|uniref:2,3-diketo-5-methylthio-1-phosphopentane phosphatase n=1 Tax=Spizellomyces punctatus (strain DAOM BR117) TaxID=645134 RepID=A0A0L0H832_SPIPD|nr:2,3-diketo-5-methylthio-1-phosphopentane phosphatase, variant [Spizellomyces punctatus DAOM BR117]XP_016605725.1 2,3-diketo-5-methylthio-1-phosphopentane phosphatase [Spizellomyces punctatus DAOM BR117]KNC97684.1 2,3-diketo-5-methylthio-1-phosphopentane phosphatase, variant [Spizellomyces punctatus DAOM BR117]KNC97685.1 2,3-diketo-5-methylthio-1-phosphopentane phosphatase [Spizellomyces punctatus DAOM BR117]|eukprot:XP_016605724.1 2,3-diketo-5-methylthio-1-phosphopentane phosphatase, variant [Spizellomyces punctatus DAOM BR117]